MVEKKVKKRIGILRGGKGKHYEKSLVKSGEVISCILENLSDTYKLVDILVDKNNVWHINGLPAEPVDLIRQVDIVWNIAYPNFHNILKTLAIPNVKAFPLGKDFVDSKEMLREQMKKEGAQLPKHLILPVYQKDFDGSKEKYVNKKAQEILQKFPAPWLVKSFNTDSAVAVHIAKTFPELVKAIQDVVSHNDSILVEELIVGKNVAVHSLNNFRDEDVYIFPPAEDRNGMTLCPSNLSSIEKEKLIILSKNLHQHLNISNYVKFDFVLTPNKRIHLINIEFSPELKKDSSFNQCCEAVGIKSHKVLEQILDSML